MNINWSEINKDYECPLNPTYQFDEKLTGMGFHFDSFAESYLQAMDILFLDFINRPTNPWMAGIIYRAGMMAIELKIKSLLSDSERKNTHKLRELLVLVKQKYKFNGNSEPFVKFIERSCDYANGSQTGRYPVDTQGNVICRDDNGNGVYIKIGQFVYSVHDLFDHYFNLLYIQATDVTK